MARCMPRPVPRASQSRGASAPFCVGTGRCEVRDPYALCRAPRGFRGQRHRLGPLSRFLLSPVCADRVCDRAGRERAASLCLVPCHCCITLVCGRSEPRPWRGCGGGGGGGQPLPAGSAHLGWVVGGGGSAAGLPHGRLRPSRWEGGPAPPPESQESRLGAPGVLCPGGSCSRGGASPAGPAASLPLCAGPCKSAVVGHSEREGTFFKAVSLSGQVN